MSRTEINQTRWLVVLHYNVYSQNLLQRYGISLRTSFLIIILHFLRKFSWILLRIILCVNVLNVSLNSLLTSSLMSYIHASSQTNQDVRESLLRFRWSCSATLEMTDSGWWWCGKEEDEINETFLATPLVQLVTSFLRSLHMFY